MRRDEAKSDRLSDSLKRSEIAQRNSDKTRAHTDQKRLITEQIGTLQDLLEAGTLADNPSPLKEISLLPALTPSERIRVKRKIFELMSKL